MKLKLSFYEFIGARLGIPGPKSRPRKPHPAAPHKSNVARPEFARLLVTFVSFWRRGRINAR